VTSCFNLLTFRSAHDMQNSAETQEDVTPVPAAWEEDEEYFST